MGVLCLNEKIIDFLLNNANPSIVLRIKKEILNCLSDEEERKLLDKIFLEKNVQTVIQSQKPDGWFGNGFHGASPKEGVGMYDNMEVGLRYLSEKGFPSENEYISKAVGAFLLDEPLFNDGRPVDDYAKWRLADNYANTAFGLYLIRSSIVLRAGYEYKLPKNDFFDLKHDIDFSFRTFANVLNYADADDAVDTNKKKPFFKAGVLWPCSYDLRILAHSQGWRNDENISILADSMNHLFSFLHSREKMVYTYIKGAFRAPCLAFIHNQIYCLGLMEEAYVNFDLMELFARCGIVEQVPFLRKKYEYLVSLVDNNLNVNYKVDSSDRNWGPYGGFALEEDWKAKVRKQCDLLFRILLIIHYVKYY